MKKTARALVTFDERPGTWMMHCHILNHAEGGLMVTRGQSLFWLVADF